MHNASRECEYQKRYRRRIYKAAIWSTLALSLLSYSSFPFRPHNHGKVVTTALRADSRSTMPGGFTLSGACANTSTSCYAGWGDAYFC